MTKQYIILIVLSFAFLKALAVNVTQKQDTSKTHILDELATRKPHANEYRLNRSGFINKYGFNDKSIQLINAFFDSYKKNIIFIISPAILLIIFLISWIIVSASVITSVLLFWGILFILSLFGYFAAWVLRILGITSLVHRKKRNLLDDLIFMKKTSKPIINNKFDPDYYEVK